MTEQVLPQPKQAEFLSTPADIALFGGAAGGGKALDVKTPVPTPAGWATMGTLKRGDKIFAPDGSTTTVTWTSRVMHDRPCYMLHFSSGGRIAGDKIVADEEHWWPAQTLSERKAGRGSMTTTKEIYTATKKKRSVYSIAVPAPFNAPPRDLPIDPYVLGLWLGDGASATGIIHIDDLFCVAEVERRGHRMLNKKKAYAWRAEGLTKLLRSSGLVHNKHIPEEYLRASPAQRLDLLRGLMDSDGHARDSGSCEFVTTSPAIRDGMSALLATLSLPSTPSERRAKIYDKDCGPRWVFYFKTRLSVFHLPRKRDRHKAGGFAGARHRVYVVKVTRVKSRPVRCIRVEHESKCFLVGKKFVPTHNSWALVAEPLRHVNTPRFACAIFRRESTQFRGAGGLWAEMEKVYPRVGARGRESILQWDWVSGAQVKAHHLENEKDKHVHQGKEYALILFDELTHFTESQFWYLLSRNRSTCGVRPYVRATCNADADSWVSRLVEWWIDENGFPDPAKRGVLRYFTRDGESLIWGDSLEEVAAKVPHVVGDSDPAEIVKSFTFISSSLDDNAHLTAKDPGYRGRLQLLDPVERERLLYGNWKIRPTSGLMFRAPWFSVVDVAPSPAVGSVRAWDLAASEGKGDWSVGLKLSDLGAGAVMVDDVDRFRLGPAGVEQRVRAVANADGPSVPVVLEVEPGSAGKAVYEAYARRVLPDREVRPSSPTGSKIVRARPVSASAEQGRVFIRRSTWTHDFIRELESFPGGAHDDQVDALSMAYTHLVISPPTPGITIDADLFSCDNPWTI